MELLRGDRLGKYEILGRLAAGGMAEVYLARSTGAAGFAKTVALKRMLPELALESGFREMFMQEAALAARLNHPGIVQIFDFAEERGEFYIAMEFVDGANLRRVLSAAADGALPEAVRCPPMVAAQIGRCVARALAHAWEVLDDAGQPLHLIHRDISPHNILISNEGDVKLADFGIARPADKRTSVGVIKGKVLYMSPEQVVAGPLDARSDVFSLGIVMYEAALNRRTPLFEGSHEDAIKAAVQSRLVVPPSRMDPDFPPCLSAVIMKSLERDPADRYQSAAELADALGEAIYSDAKGPQDYDVGAFMRRLEPQRRPIRGLVPDVVAPLASELVSDRSGPEPVLSFDSDPAARRGAPRPGPDPAYRSELERRGDDPFAETVSPRQAEALRALAPGSSEDPGCAGEPGVGQVGMAVVGVPRLPAVARAGLCRMWRSWPLFAGLAGLIAIAGVMASVQGLRTQDSASVVGGTVETPMTSDGPLVTLEPDPRTLTQVVMAEGPMSEPVAPRNAEPALVPAGVPVRVDAQPEPKRPVEGQPREPAPQPSSAAGAEKAGPAAVVTFQRAAAREKRYGELVIQIRPWAFAWIDGETFTGKVDQEAAPRLRRRVTAGRHILHLQEPGGRRREITVLVPADREVRVDGSFDRFTVH